MGTPKLAQFNYFQVLNSFLNGETELAKQPLYQIAPKRTQPPAKLKGVRE